MRLHEARDGNYLSERVVLSAAGLRRGERPLTSTPYSIESLPLNATNADIEVFITSRPWYALLLDVQEERIRLDRLTFSIGNTSTRPKARPNEDTSANSNLDPGPRQSEIRPSEYDALEDIPPLNPRDLGDCQCGIMSPSVYGEAILKEMRISGGGFAECLSPDDQGGHQLSMPAYRNRKWMSHFENVEEVIKRLEKRWLQRDGLSTTVGVKGEQVEIDKGSVEEGEDEAASKRKATFALFGVTADTSQCEK
ncbi:hypothetical protein VTI74DRAFT_4046 [Chaetomium olivicolor]